MLKTEAELIVRRVAEETSVEFSDEQVSALAQIVIKITGRMIEEALAAQQASRPGTKPEWRQ